MTSRPPQTASPRPDTVQAAAVESARPSTAREWLLLLPPFVLALYPLLFTWVSFPTLADVQSLQRAVITAALVTTALLVVCRMALRTWPGASAAVSVMYVSALCFLAIWPTLSKWPAHAVLGVAWLAASVLLAAALGRQAMRQHHRAVCLALGITAAVVVSQVVAPLLPDGAALWKTQASELVNRVERVGPAPTPAPDIYYIVLDAYGRADVLSREYGLVNAPFIDGLRSRGFYVADAAQSNYVQTDLSLASSLNMTYLDPLDRYGDRNAARYLIHRSEVARLLRQAGYEFVLIGSDYAPTMSLADVDECECRVPLPGWFELLLARGQIGVAPWLENRAYAAHAGQVLGELQDLSRTAAARADQPRFVFAHIVAPHPPFVFRPDGSLHVPNRPFSIADASQYPGSPDEYRTGYREQLLFINSQVLPAIDAIIQRSRVPPIIVLQGDHGPALGLSWLEYKEEPARNRAGILAAFLTNDRVRAGFYPSITPVNFFRVVLGGLFGTQLPLLSDESFYSPWSRPFAFTRIPPRSAETAP